MHRKYITGLIMTLMISTGTAGMAYASAYQFFSPDKGYVYVPESEVKGHDLKQYMADHHYFGYKLVPDAAADNYVSDNGPGVTSQSKANDSSVVIVPESTPAAEKETKETREEKETYSASSNSRRNQTESREETTAAPAEVSHGPYKGITDEAEDAFISFCTDDIHDNAYIFVTEDVDHMVIAGNVLSYTGSGKEDGYIVVKDESGTILYEYTFPQLNIRDNVFFDLILKKEKRDNGLYVTFNRDQDFGASVGLRILTPYQNEKVHVYNEKNALIDTVDTDEDGYAEFNINRTRTLWISTETSQPVNETGQSTETKTAGESESADSESGDQYSTWQYGAQSMDTIGQTESTASVKTEADGKTYEMPSKNTVDLRKHTSLDKMLPSVFVAVGAAGLIAAIIFVLKRYFS